MSKTYCHQLLQQLESTSLDEINSHAELLTRVDRKYVLPLSAVALLLEQLQGYARVLEINQRVAHPYASTYFDTDDLASYHLAAYGRRRRFKVRARTYVESGLTFIEVKTKGANKQTIKERIAYSPNDGRLTPEAIAYVDQTLAAAGITGMAARDLNPVLITEYERATLFLPNEGARSTIDFELKLSAPDTRAIGFESVAVVETKSGSTPSSVDRMIWAMGYRQSKISKFGTGLAALRHELPANKWHRVLSRDLQLKPTN